MGLRVPVAGGGVGRDRVFDRGEILAAQFVLGGLHRFGEALQAGRADHRNNVIATTQTPREGQLGDGVPLLAAIAASRSTRPRL